MKNVDPGADPQNIYEQMTRQVQQELTPTTLPEVKVTAPRMTTEEAAAYDAVHGSMKEMGFWDGVFTFNPLGRTLSGVGHAITNTVTSIPTVFRQFAYTAGDVGGYIASAAPWVPKHQPMSALFQTLQNDGPAPIVRNVAHGLVSPLKNLYDGGMYGRYEQLNK